MRLVTAPYKNKTFFFPLSSDKKEGFWAVPLTLTVLTELRQKAVVEAGADYEVAEQILDRIILEDRLRGWKGFEDGAGQAVSFSREAVRELWELNPDLAKFMVQSIRQLFRVGELDEKKN